MSESVVHGWVAELPLMFQGTLMTGIRGPDGHHCPAMKPVTRWLRSLVLRSGNPENDFSRVPAELPALEDFEHEMEHVPVHFFLHLLHCMEIVGYKHPDPGTADIGLDYYHRMVSWLHLSPEPEDELDERLSGRPGTTGSAKSWVGMRRIDRPKWLEAVGPTEDEAVKLLEGLGYRVEAPSQDVAAALPVPGTAPARPSHRVFGNSWS